MLLPKDSLAPSRRRSFKPVPPRSESCSPSQSIGCDLKKTNKLTVNKLKHKNNKTIKQQHKHHNTTSNTVNDRSIGCDPRPDAAGRVGRVHGDVSLRLRPPLRRRARICLLSYCIISAYLMLHGESLVQNPRTISVDLGFRWAFARPSATPGSPRGKHGLCLYSYVCILYIYIYMCIYIYIYTYIHIHIYIYIYIYIHMYYILVMNDVICNMNNYMYMNIFSHIRTCRVM